ncbi:LacI family DNA-binding transcriptional regulator [Ktedonobacter racemifer]|uniref:Transcriptional regulator, LacI family n=1 Tax=Ktedonobacter racemifer DSM 44963 TaxID=485913 RepID=D6TYY8_KTERA|nr:LacI family DNA-binding transcriptional regulator [Ktedonobacter racemifer]EFH81778.1 transcriptional regulator, LacI family [Ktedonobacter racemifer DSM 44963]
MVRGKESRSITSVDVARKAGVSQSTVSLVFAGKASGRVSPQTQQEVLRIAEEMGYRPNTVARTLRLGHTNIIAFVIPDVSNPFFAAVLKGAEQTARLHDYTVILVSTGEDQEWQRVVMDALTTHSIEGFVLCAVRPPGDMDIAILRSRAVIVDETWTGLSSLSLDIVGGTQAAMRHLFGLGHRQVAHLAADVDVETFRQRQRTYEQELALRGLVLEARYTARAALNPASALQAARKLLHLSEPPTAIFCDDDLLAIGAYKAAAELGWEVPRQLSIVGFGDGLIAQTLAPELTTVAIPTAALGKRAIEVLLADFEVLEQPHSEVISLELRVRGSTTAVAGNA